MLVTPFVVSLLLVLAACGEDSDTDSMPNILTGLSGIVIAALVVWWLVRRSRRR